ncbi:hypothetical protein BD410DRAFT_795815 [Rickenella mellea]|uniref:Uncharacterized protein n=1 Tax=Rickenella mellea TaxID=50990 RepID=A0A4Y7PNG5_9AGAM|nr:hypothetical protein BD410DRAFT_795815 [Rickenella mellea]
MLFLVRVSRLAVLSGSCCPGDFVSFLTGSGADMFNVCADIHPFTFEDDGEVQVPHGDVTVAKGILTHIVITPANENNNTFLRAPYPRSTPVKSPSSDI